MLSYEFRIASAVLWFIASAPLSVCADDWLQWGGPRGDFTVEAGALVEKWPAGGLKQIWKRPLGDGYSCLLRLGDRLFTMYRDREDEIVVALDAATGKTIWEHHRKPVLWSEMTHDFGLGPNATPVIIDDRIIAIGIDGFVRCHGVDTGDLVWTLDLPAEFGRRKRVEEYGYSASPLPHNGLVLVQVGGDNHAVIALHPKDGSIAWKSGPGGVSYAAATITKLAGRVQYVYFEPEGVVGLDPDTGKSLWRAPIEFDNGNHLTPIVPCDETHLWVGSQFPSGGGRLLALERTGGSLEAKQEWFTSKLRASHWTSIRIGDHIYGSIGGNDMSFLAAFEWKTGKIVWRERGFHKAQCLYADGKLLFLDENGKLGLAKVSPTELTILDSAQLTESVSWTLPTLTGTTLYLRDRKHVLALDLSAEP